jgi:predicted transcriptional regulator
MKTAISLPAEVFERAERLAHQQGRSRSELYATAVREYVARHELDEVTETLDRVVAELGYESADFRREAARRVAERTEW